MRTLQFQLGNLVAACLLVGCATVNRSLLNIPGQNGYVEYVPQDPLPSPRVTYYDQTGQEVTKAWAQLTNADIQRLLSDTHAQISVGKWEASGKLTYLVAQATGSAGSYHVVMDYCEYRAEPVKDQAGNVIGEGRVGVGLRMTAEITTLSADVNLGSLLALGVAASTGKMRGTMTVDSIGIRLAGTAGPILTNATIDETSIQKTLEALAIIQSKIADPTTSLDPQLIAVRPTTATATPAEVAKPLIEGREGS